MSPPTPKARQVHVLVGLIRSGGPVCVSMAVITMCIIALWQYMGREAASTVVEVMRIWREGMVAQQLAADANAKSIDLAARIVDRAERIVNTVGYRQADGRE